MLLGRLARSASVAVLGSAAAAALTVGPAAAAVPGGYGAWRMSGSAGSLTVPVTGFPSAAVTSTSTRTAVPSGSTTFLGPRTPFGQAFGSSRGHGYLSVRTGPAGTPSTTTLNFNSPTPAGGWGFALGDIEADHMRIDAIGANGSPLTAAQLGFRGAFNYCAAGPKPAGCTRPPFTDTPTWDPATRTLLGNVTDTDGAAGWFRPTVAVRSMTFTFSVQSGIPVGQIWVAADERTVSGTVRVKDGTPPPHTTIMLRHPEGTAVTGPDGSPLTAVTDDRGNYSFPGLAAGRYTVAMRTPSRFRAVGPTVRRADARTQDAVRRDFLLERIPAPLMRSEQFVDVRRDTVDVPVPRAGGEEPARIVVTDPPDHGTLSVHDGYVEYTPDPGFRGRDAFTYRATYRDGEVVDRTDDLNVPRPAPRTPNSAPAPHGSPGPALAATGGAPWLLPAAGISAALLAAGGSLLLLVRRRRRV